MGQRHATLGRSSRDLRQHSGQLAASRNLGFSAQTDDTWVVGAAPRDTRMFVTWFSAVHGSRHEWLGQRSATLNVQRGSSTRGGRGGASRHSDVRHVIRFRRPPSWPYRTTPRNVLRSVSTVNRRERRFFDSGRWLGPYELASLVLAEAKISRDGILWLREVGGIPYGILSRWSLYLRALFGTRHVSGVSCEPLTHAAVSRLRSPLAPNR